MERREASEEGKRGANLEGRENEREQREKGNMGLGGGEWGEGEFGRD